MSQENSELSEVAIVKGETPKECIKEGLNELGGISRFINEGDQVFIKFNLTLPHGFPTNTNLNSLAALIQSCKDAGADKIYLGSFPFKGMTIKAVSEVIKLNTFIKNLGAELVYLDNSNYFQLKGYNEEQLKTLKNTSFKEVEVEGKKFQVPKIFLKADKFITINQVNVEPLFKCRLSLQNLFSVLQNKLKQEHEFSEDAESKTNNHYIDNYVSAIFDVYSIKKPDLVINDLFYILEGAGPYIYSDSKLKNTGLMVIGNNIGAVDITTLKLLKLDLLKNPLYDRAIKKAICPGDLSNVKLIGENIEDIDIDIELCASKLEDIELRGVDVKAGDICSGCFKQAYHLFNLMKTNMIKDLKYLSKISFLIGENAPNPETFDSETEIPSEDIFIFGDCAINSTQDRKFRKITDIKRKKTKLEKIQTKIQKLQLKKIRETHKKKIQKLDTKIKKREATFEGLKQLPHDPSAKVKEKQNKKILEFSGCPPDLFEGIESIINYYGEKEVPTLNLFYRTLKSYIYRKMKKRLELWERL